MNENITFGDKNKNTTLMLGIGGVILLACLLVCLFLVSVLRATYSGEISSDFQSHHESTAHMADSFMAVFVNVVDGAVGKFGEATTFPNDEEILNILDMYQKIKGVYSVSFINSSDKYYHDGIIENKGEKFGSIYWKDIESKYTKTEGENAVIPVLADLGTGEKKYMIIEEPVYYKSYYMGVIVVSVDITHFFRSGVFEYLTTVGECYIVDAKGDVITSSDNLRIFADPSKDLFTSIEEYTIDNTAQNKSIHLLKNAITNSESDFQTFKTLDGYSLQISISPIKSVHGMYYVSCFNDNIVDDKVQPLIFRSVLSCIIIIVLMILVILYVWATAKRANLTIERLAYMDLVTEGRNINYFKEFANHIMSVFKETPFVIYRFDILNFRYINEAYGHTRADGVLKVCIKNFEDVFSEKELCVRMNADQFLAIVVNDKSIDQRVQKFTDKVNQDARGLGIKYPIKFKTGICQIKKHEHDIDVLIDHANVARKTLSGDEKEMRAVYSESIVNDMRKIDRIESEQQRALATEEFKVFLQPKWDIIENRIAGAEALVRWIKADGTRVFPDEFIPVFENNGFVEKLDFYMLEKVCQEMKERFEAGKPVYPVSVNQSRLLLHSSDYVKNVEKIIKQNNIPDGFIELEITETVFENERDAMISTMKELKKLGVKLSMDDFGSGYSSLNMLKDAPFDILKIDREFFSESVTSEASLCILQKIVEMADGLGMKVICEGVETGEQVVLLQSIGCRYVQGYYYSKPIPAEDFYQTYCE